jgi:hypothetical protein
MSLFFSSIGQFLKNYGGVIIVGGVTVIGVRSYIKNVECENQQRKCDLFCENLKNMKQFHGDSFLRDDTYNMMSPLSPYCDCQSAEK